MIHCDQCKKELPGVEQLICACGKHYCPDCGEKIMETSDFTRFFTEATKEEKLKLLEEVARKANEDQKRMSEKYETEQKKETPLKEGVTKD